MYMFLGTIKQVIIGPASITSIITLQFTRDRGVRFVHLLTFYTGLVQLAMTVFRLGEWLPRGQGCPRPALGHASSVA